MKNTISALILVLAAGQTQAEGFYQKVVADAPQSGQEAGQPVRQFEYTPLYLRVVGESDHSAEIRTHAPALGYTPLYEQITARAGRRDRI